MKHNQPPEDGFVWIKGIDSDYLWARSHAANPDAWTLYSNTGSSVAHIIPLTTDDTVRWPTGIIWHAVTSAGTIIVNADSLDEAIAETDNEVHPRAPESSEQDGGQR